MIQVWWRSGSHFGSGADDLGRPPQISLDAEEAMGVEDGSTCIEVDPLVDTSLSASLTTVPCHVSLEDISQVLREGPSMQP